MLQNNLHQYAEQLKEKLILTALETPEFKMLLRDTTADIIKEAESAKNEATIESSFEHELYGLLKNINFKFLPEKEVAIDTRRHIGKGRMDSKIGAVVIEYKHPQKLNTSEDLLNATKQLESYLEGLSKQNPAYYYGFLTDGLRCKEIIFQDSILLSESSLVQFTPIEALRLIKNIVLLTKTALNPKNFISDFCGPKDDSIVIKMTKVLFQMLKTKPTQKTQMLKTEWEQLFKLGHEDKSQQRMIQEREKALQEIVSQKFEGYDQYSALFALQTTYAIIVKLIAYRIISELRFEKVLKSYHSWLTADEKTLRIFCESLEEGDIFRDLGIINLLEGDFFSWYADSNQWNNEIANIIRRILEILARYENASEIFKTRQTTDLFKGLYENIVPQVVRSSLGEFYTPQWLTEHILMNVKPEKNWRGLDPCSGSGTFVLTMIDAVLKEVEEQSKEDKLKAVINRVNAIDINPLAVLTCRINYFIRISNLIPERPSHLQIPVYLGDACYVPEEKYIGNVKCLNYTIKTAEKPILIIIPKSLTTNIQHFSEIMTQYEALIRKCNLDKALTLLLEHLDSKERTEEILSELRRLTEELIYLEQKGWNGIWARIISNFLATANLGTFDIIIGNPPWIDWKNLPSGYRERIKTLCINRNLFSGDGRTGGINLNVCALIASVSVDNWLTVNGKLAFLMPKVIAFQQSYEGFRKFNFSKVNRDFIGFYDWSKAGHPFDPIKEKFMTYVIGNSNGKKESIPVKEFVKLKGAKIAGEHHLTLKEAMLRLEEKNYVAGQVIPESTIFTFADSEAELQSFKMIAGKPEYIGREGIEFFPQELQLFKISESPPTNAQKGNVYVTNIQFEKSKYKIPEDTFELETEYLQPLVKGTEIEKFQHNYEGILVPFPYDERDARRPLNQQQLHSESPKLLNYYIKYRHVIEAQTDYSDKIRGAGSIMKCNTWRSRKGAGTLSRYGKTIQTFEHR